MAIAFGMQHKHVMRTIRAMLASDIPEIAEHGRANFGATSYTDSQGRQKPMFRMTADGLTELGCD